ncbi:hypothetical protein PI27_gp094 [Listeria phage WIL-1]|uniref:hypothetical protein n=1 Tax=Listeria phage WIL-1 TaxID=1541821 RepID=UPI00248CB996|nr:hypothetical protein PI27_gp094 [Listeria phage WIL-1]
MFVLHGLLCTLLVLMILVGTIALNADKQTKLIVGLIQVVFMTMCVVLYITIVGVSITIIPFGVLFAICGAVALFNLLTFNKGEL